MGTTLTTAAEVVAALRDNADPTEEAKIRARVAGDEPVIGVRMGTLFDIAKAATDVPAVEFDALVTHAAYESRMAAFCILDFRSRRVLSDEERATLAQTYLARHDAITAWDMVDRAAPRVLGRPILTGAVDGAILDELARSADPLRRRSAITAPLWFVKKGSSADVERGLVVADSLDDDEHPHVRSAVRTYRKHAARRVPPSAG
ncbi:hypothetical protein FHS23_001645 [Prauserella isguenensis]|uniref:DNA alkylation repair protein n=1 Tax=Prauserella isguenensis TaxID=1470180 RepID=A0A839S0R3_9PSEU|nr:hypothetical protein [Prauserella isguenensis]